MLNKRKRNPRGGGGGGIRSRGGGASSSSRAIKKQKVEVKLTIQPMEKIWVEQKLGRIHQHMELMSSGPLYSHREYIQKIQTQIPIHALDVVQKWYLEFLAKKDPASFVNLKQKSLDWLVARCGRLTGSAAPGFVGHNHHSHPLTQIKDFTKSFEKSKKEIALLALSSSSGSSSSSTKTSSLFDQEDDEEEDNNDDDQDKLARAQFGGQAMAWGSAKEYYAAHCYCQYQYQESVKTYREQRLAYFHAHTNQIKDWKTFDYRGRTFPVIDPFQDPVVEIRNWSFLRSYLPHRGISPDGVLIINGVPCAALEVKCPFAKRKRLHLMFHTGYYDQIMCELYLLQSYWPTIGWIDYVNWTPTAWTLDTFVLNQEYFHKWFLPREARSYFKCALPLLCANILIKFKASQHSTDDEIWSATKMLSLQSDFMQFLCDFYCFTS